MLFQLIPYGVAGSLLMDRLGGVFRCVKGARRHTIYPQVPHTERLLLDNKYRHIRFQFILHGQIITDFNAAMTKANFFFHGLFPDYLPPDKGQGTQCCKVLFDVDFAGEFYSHLLADILPVGEEDGVPTFEVRHDLPFRCDDFSKTVVCYYQQVLGPQSSTISHSGPKGPIPNKNVYRVQWQVSLNARARETGTPPST